MVIGFAIALLSPKRARLGVLLAFGGLAIWMVGLLIVD